MRVSNESLKRILFFKFVLVVVISLVFYVLLLSIKQTAFSIYNRSSNIALSAFIPEGWGFFTRDPQEEKFRVYLVKDNFELEEMDFQVSSNQNYHGLSRKIRRKFFEISQVVGSVPNDAWYDYSGTRENLCLDSDQKLFEIELDKKNFFLLKNEKLLVYKYSVIPWEWSQITDIEEGKIAYVSVVFK